MSVIEAKVRELAERCARVVIEALGTMALGELAGLVLPRPAPVVRTRTKWPAKRAKPPKANVPKTASTRKTTPTKKAAPAKAGTVIKRSDGRTFTNTAKAIAAHKLQGQYIGHLGQVPAKEKDHFRKIAHEKGVAAALAALMKRLGKEPTATTKTAARKAAPKAAKKAVAAAPAKRKAKAMPASYYRCAHPGCTKNWFVKGRPYCGEHAKLHGRRKA